MSWLSGLVSPQASSLDRVPLVLPVQWKQAQHLAIVGDTGTGKSTLASRLLDARTYPLVFRSKPDDVKWRGYRRIRTAAEMDGIQNSRLVLVPKLPDQVREFWLALNRVYREGGWTPYLDELFYLDDKLGLRDPIETLLTQGRSKHLTVVVGMQRPVQVTRFAISQCRHVLSFWQEGRDAKELAAATRPAIADVVASLDEFEFVWFSRPKTIWKGRLNLRTNQLEGSFVAVS